MKFKFPDRKIMAGGLASIAVYVLAIIAEWRGVPVSSDVLGLLITLVGPIVSFMVPPAVRDVAARLDADIRQVFLERQAAEPGFTPPRE